MYVLIISRGYPSERYKMNGIFEFDQAKALAEIGHKVIFAAVDMRSIRRSRKWGIERKSIEGIDIYAINIPAGRLPMRLFYNLSNIALNILYKKILKEQGKPDIMHAHFPSIGYIAFKLKKKYNIPLVLTEHLSSIMKPVIDKGLFKVAKKTYNNVDEMITVSPQLKYVISEKFGKKSIYIPNIVDTQIFNYTLNNNSETFRFVSIGSLIFRKRMDLTIEAFARNYKKNNKITLTIFGEGPERPNLEKLISKHNIKHVVKLMGLQDRNKIAEVLKNSDCFVLPSQYETFGVAYIEALASGIPVIATRCGGPEGFITKDNGILIEVDNLIELSNAMLDMEKNNSNYNRELISISIINQFSSKVVATKLTEVYKTILKDN